MVEAYGDDKGELWLGKTLAFDGFNARSPCCSKKHTGQQANKYATRFNNGDYMIAAQGTSACAKAETASGSSS